MGVELSPKCLLSLWTGAPQCLRRPRRGTTWVEQDGAKPLPMLSFACSEAKERLEPMTRRAERCEESGYAPVPRHAGAGEMTILFEHSIPHANGRRLARL